MTKDTTSILTILALWLDLDQHLLLAHHLDNLSNIASRFLQNLQLLTQQSDYSMSAHFLRLNPRFRLLRYD